MEKSVFAIFLICLPGLLSASCSSGGSGSASTHSDSNFGDKNSHSISNNNNPHNYYSYASLQDVEVSHHPIPPDLESRGEECKNGWCGEDGSCICNPCWSGPTCQEYVDRFAPRFLAEEPFFIVESTTSNSGYSTFLDPAFDPVYPQWPADFFDSSSPLPPSAPSPQPPLTSSGGQVTNGPAPLFRIESADDDLGLTCQLGQVGPAATCPCATPRYKVVGATTTFPDSLSPPKSEFKFEAVEEKLSKKEPLSDRVGGRAGDGEGAVYDETGQTGMRLDETRNGDLFWADEETGDVFLHQGFTLEPSNHYFITLQVSALQVNSSGFKPWKDEVVATLYVKPSSSPLETSSGFTRWRAVQKYLPQTPPTFAPTDIPSSGLPKIRLIGDQFIDDDDDSSESTEIGSSSPTTDLNAKSRLLSDARKGSAVKAKERSGRRELLSIQRKNKLPYALRGDRPHYKFSDNRISTYSDRKTEAQIREERRQPFLHRWKRQSSVPEEFELTLSRLTEKIKGEELCFGDKIKMQLLIHVPSVDFVDFDVEILSSNEESRFAILSAHVSSIGSDISFDKDQTNLAPILKPSKNVSLYESAVWHWKAVRRSDTLQKERKKSGIRIEFEIVSVGGVSYSNSSRSAPLLQLSSLRASSSSSPSSTTLASSSTSSSSSPTRKGTNVKTLGELRRYSTPYLLPIQARLSFPSKMSHNPPKQSHDPPISHQSDLSEKVEISVNTCSTFSSRSSRNSSRSQLPPSSLIHHRGYIHTSTHLNYMMQKHRKHEMGVWVEVEGPREIPQGDWKSYRVRVFLRQACQFKLTIEQKEGNHIDDQDSISVGDIRLVSIGKDIASCSEIPKKGGFRVSCKKSGGRKGDLCSVESPQLNFCPLLPSSSNGEEGARDWSDGGKDREDDGNVLEFQGIIYGLPSASAGSQFLLRAHVLARSPPAKTSREDVQVYEDEGTLAGKIVKRRREGSNYLNNLSTTNMNEEEVDGKIAVMPKEEEGEEGARGGGYGAKGRSRRSKRSVFPSSPFLSSRSVGRLGRQSASAKSLHRRRFNSNSNQDWTDDHEHQDSSSKSSSLDLSEK